MKKYVLGILAALTSYNGLAQNLSAGDIAFIGYHSRGNNLQWTFITLTAIPANEEIYFTDRGWVNGAWASGSSAEDHVVWTAPGSGIDCGTVIHIEETTSDNFTVTGGGSAVVAPGSASFALSISGDQLLAYRGGAGAEPVSPTFLAGIHMNYLSSNYDAATGWGDGSANSITHSDVPAGLTNGVNCLSLGLPSLSPTEVDNAKYVGSLDGDSSVVRALICDASQWTRVNTNLDITVDGYVSTLDCVPASTWSGGMDGDWNEASNWSKGEVPTSTTKVVIPSGPTNVPHITADPASPAQVDDLTIESGGTLIIDAGKALTISGDLDNEGTLLVKADASGIGSLIDNGTVTGSGAFQVEHYVSGAGGASPSGRYWYVSSPVASATSNVFNASGTDRLWSADESTQSYTEITDNVTALNVMEGYITKIGATSTKTYTGGKFNTGDLSTGGLSRTGTTEENRGYHLVGNPYPSSVSWDDATKTNLETTVWYRTHNGSVMVYDTYNAAGQVGTNNNGSGAVIGSIPPTQAFWVRVSADGLTGQLDLTNAMRSHGTRSSIYRPAETSGTLRMVLSDGMVSDEQVLLFNEDAFDAVDDYDSKKFWGSSSHPQLYTVVGTDTLVINGMNSLETNQQVLLGMKVPVDGEYTLQATQTMEHAAVLLEDRLLGTMQDLILDPVHTFSATRGNTGNRFVLHFEQAVTGIEGSDGNEPQVIASGNHIRVMLGTDWADLNAVVRVVDPTGQLVEQRQVLTDNTQIDMGGATGVYVVYIESRKQLTVRKVIL